MSLARTKPMLPLELLEATFSYEPLSGHVIWKPNPQKSGRWHTRYAGKPLSYVNQNGYIQVDTCGASYNVHRIAWSLYNKRLILPTEYIDHINGIRSDNRIENLRVVTPADNSSNIGLRPNNTSGETGVQRTANGRYRVTFCRNGVSKSLGTFESFEDAVFVRRAAVENELSDFSPHICRKLVEERSFVPLRSCPSGPFETKAGNLGFKTEYSIEHGAVTAFCMESGEFFWGGTSDPAMQAQVLVRPVVLVRNLVGARS